MPIKKPGSQLMKSVKLKTMKKLLSKKSGRSVDVALNLTPMIDMFVVLVIFLLISFSTSGEILFIQKDIEMPKASQADDLKEAPIIMIGRVSVGIEDKNVGSITEIEEDENFEIPDLSERLTTLRKRYGQLYPNKKFPGMVILQGDKDVNFRVIKKVMYTCTTAGYSNINFAVIPTGGNKKAAAAAPGTEG